MNNTSMNQYVNWGNVNANMTGYYVCPLNW